MRDGWIKHFADGSRELGYDHLVGDKQASWSRGRLEGMTAVEVHHNGTTVMIEGTGEFWQWDTLEADLLSSNTKIIGRTISKKIHEKDTGFTVNDGVVRFFTLRALDDNIFFTTEEDIGKSFILEIECGPPNHVSWRIE